MDETKAELTPKQQKKAEKARKRREKKQKKWAKQYRLIVPANKKGLHKMPFMNFLRFIGYPIHRFLYPFKMYGYKKVGPGAYIYVGNHLHMFDIFYVARTTKEGIHFLSKQSILEAPVVGYIARRLGAIGAMRDGSDVRTIMDAMKVLRNGEKVSLFPEGTRNRGSGEEFLPFHGGAAIFAIKTKTPIIPFVICSRPRLFHMTHVVFGEPMELSEYYDRKVTPEDYAEAEEKLKNRLYELRAEHRAMHAEKKNKKKNKKKKEKG